MNFTEFKNSQCGGFAAVGVIDRLQQQATAHNSTAVSSKCEQSHVVNKLNTDLFRLIVFLLKFSLKCLVL